jgi:hypothetical protein
MGLTTERPKMSTTGEIGWLIVLAHYLHSLEKVQKQWAEGLTTNKTEV